MNTPQSHSTITCKYECVQVQCDFIISKNLKLVKAWSNVKLCRSVVSAQESYISNLILLE